MPTWTRCAEPSRPTSSARGGSPRRPCRSCARTAMGASSTSRAAWASSRTWAATRPAMASRRPGSTSSPECSPPSSGTRTSSRQLGMPRLGAHRHGHAVRATFRGGGRRHARVARGLCRTTGRGAVSSGTESQSPGSRPAPLSRCGASHPFKGVSMLRWQRWSRPCPARSSPSSCRSHPVSGNETDSTRSVSPPGSPTPTTGTVGVRVLPWRRRGLAFLAFLATLREMLLDAEGGQNRNALRLVAARELRSSPFSTPRSRSSLRPRYCSRRQLHA